MKSSFVFASVGIVLALGGSASALNFSDTGGWHYGTSLDTTSINRGDATKVAWSIVPDGTRISYPGTTTNDMNTKFTQRYGANAMNTFKTVFDRIGSVSGLQFVQSSDDGAAAGEETKGLAGVRGDFRIAGSDIYTAFGGWGGGGWCNLPGPSRAVIMHLNTGLTWPTLSEWQYIAMHEAGHGIGFGHQTVYETPTATGEYRDANGYYGSITGFMNPNGPQFDDVYAMHRMYGDRLERDAGNDTIAKATDMGNLTDRATALGTDTNGLAIAASLTDFLSIDGTSDADFFKFHVSGKSTVDLKVTAKGPNYAYAVEGTDWAHRTIFDAAKQSDLFFDLYDSEGIALAHTNSAGLGGIESLNTVLEGGDYYMKIAGLQDSNQMYRLDMATELVPEPSSLLAMGMGILGIGIPTIRLSRRK